MDFPSELTLHGPFSVRRAREEEQPGPPVSQTMRGISSGDVAVEEEEVSWAGVDELGEPLLWQLKKQGHLDWREGVVGRRLVVRFSNIQKKRFLSLLVSN